MLKFEYLLAALFVFANLHYSQSEDDDAAKQIELPEGHPQHCKFLFKDGGDMRVLGVLPGIGWDNLRNVFMDMVIEHEYKTCTFTEDEFFLIPDGMFTIPTKESQVDIYAEVFDQWSSYRSALSGSINAQVTYDKVIWSVSGSFSTEVQKNKQRQVSDKSITTRVQVRHRLYQVLMGSRATLSKLFKARVIEIGNTLANEDSVLAAYLADKLVRDYGTHVLTKVDAGAALMQESQIKKEFMKTSNEDEISAMATASASFLRGRISASASVKANSNTQSMKSFQTSTTSSRIESYGGSIYKTNISMSEWEGGIRENLVAIDKAGEPLYTIITNVYIEELPPFLVRQVSLTVKLAISRYYELNTVTGCTNSSSHNFNFLANSGGSDLCIPISATPHNNFKFGGVFTRCTTIINSPKGKRPICEGKSKINPKTRTASCPNEYTQIEVLSQTVSKTYDVQVEKEECTKNWIGRQKCKTITIMERKMASAKITAYWCAGTKATLQHSYSQFGGMYTHMIPNPLTETSKCPPYFTPLPLGSDLYVCVRDATNDPQVEFGGIFTCKFGNPFSEVLPSSKKSVSDYMKQCPKGFTSHIATITDNRCRVTYCIRYKTEMYFNTATPILPLKRPPYTTRPEPSANASNTMAFMDEGDTWMKDETTGEWTQYGMDEEMPAQLEFLVSSAATTYYHSPLHYALCIVLYLHITF